MSPDTKPSLAPALASGPNAPSPAARPGAVAHTTAAPPVVPRPRQQYRKKAIYIEPDPLYHAGSTSFSASSTHAHAQSTSSVAGAKRGVDGATASEPRKRKRVDANAHGHSLGHGMTGRAGAGSAIASASGANSNINNNGTGLATGAADTDGQASLIEFSTLPTSALYEYIIQFNLEPLIYPTPLTAEDPPPPAALLNPTHIASRTPTPTPLVTPANRPRRSKERDVHRRRSTRLLEEEKRGVGTAAGMEQVPVLADVRSIHGVLATIVGRHFRESSVREVDTLASFMGAVRARR